MEAWLNVGRLEVDEPGIIAPCAVEDGNRLVDGSGAWTVLGIADMMDAVGLAELGLVFVSARGIDAVCLPQLGRNYGLT